MLLKYVTNIKETEIILSSELINRNNIVYKKILLHLGCWKKELSVKYMDNWPPDTLGLSRDLSKDFVLPDSIPYKIRFEDRNIYIGPIIGMIFDSKEEALTPKLLSSYEYYLHSYNVVKGLVFIGSSEGINVKNQTIKGYFYQPDSKESWVEGVFPYPDALYRRIGIPNEKYDDLIKHIGDGLFNTYYFDKWELWETLYPYDEMKQHLPHTERLTDINILVNMLEKYNIVYLKRIFSEQSKGIYRVKKLEKGYEFIDKEKKETIFANMDEVSKFLNEITIKNGSYIVQQAIKAKSFENRSFDMRIVLQKDESKRWNCSGIIAKFGGSGSIASIIRLDGLAMSGKEGLKKVFNLTEEQVFIKEREIINLCIKVCEILDKSIGHYGDLGFDVIIDEEGKAWILEINKNHYHRFPLYALKDRQMYTNITSKPLRYASSLSGFKDGI